MSKPDAEPIYNLTFSGAPESSEEMSDESIIHHLNSPADIQNLTVPQLKKLADETRERIIEVISRNAGHFGSPLGVVELTVALMNQFDLEKDKVVWDVGHQAYAWKILTGRYDEFETIRQYGGISGFLKRSESKYDAFGAGHASTSISAALGMAHARDLKHEDNRICAVIGDGAMTGGMAYEALNNAGLRKSKMLVVFNDNEISISENVWVVHKMFQKAVTSPVYQKFRQEFGSIVKRYSSEAFIDYAHRMEESVKGLIVPGTFFEELGFRYVGPLDGHDIGAMTEVLSKIKDHHGPVLLHVITQKGKGYKFAENDPIKYHAAANMCITDGKMKKKKGPPAFTKIFGEALVEEGKRDSRLVGITAAMDSGTGLNIWAKKFPKRYFDVGIAEENAVTMAAGMATEGLKPVCAIYSTFMQRAFDQVIHDVALQKLNVFFVLDRGGLVGADGPTHHGVFDLSYLRIVPDLVVMASSCAQELVDMIHTGTHYDGAIALRYPRGAADTEEPLHEPKLIEIGKGEVLQEGEKVALIGIGKLVGHFEKAAQIIEEKQGFKPTVINARFVKPLDEELILETAKTHEFLFTAEDNVLAGGFGSGVNELLNEKGAGKSATCFGIPDRFVDHGKPEELFEELGLNPEQLADRIIEKIKA